jgi:nucleoside phosphorylase
MSLVFVFAASAMEAEPVRKFADSSGSSSTWRCGVNEIVLFEGAMGPRNAKAKAESALGGTGKPDAILVIGLCGGLNASLEEGAIAAYDACVSTVDANGKLVCSAKITEAIFRLLQPSTPPRRVVGVTSSRIATNRAERAALAEHGADVVDMESYSIMTVAGNAGVPVVVLRVVADSLDRRLPDLNRALNDTGGLDGRKALGVALRSPVATVRLLSANKRAMQRLAGALEIVLKAPCFG